MPAVPEEHVHFLTSVPTLTLALTGLDVLSNTATATNEDNMRTTTCALGIFLLLALTSTSRVSSSTQPSFKAEDDFTLTKVADGVYGAIAKPGGLASGNAGFVVGDEGVLVVDTFFTPVAVEELIDCLLYTSDA